MLILIEGGGKMKIPEKLLSQCEDYFNSDRWFYICHPRLDYSSPIAWIDSGKDVSEVEKILDDDTKNF